MIRNRNEYRIDDKPTNIILQTLESLHRSQTGTKLLGNLLPFIGHTKVSKKHRFKA